MWGGMQYLSTRDENGSLSNERSSEMVASVQPFGLLLQKNAREMSFNSREQLKQKCLLSIDEFLVYKFTSGIWFGFELYINNFQAPNPEMVYFHLCNRYVH